jgi:Domain of unknown function (DUF4386)
MDLTKTTHQVAQPAQRSAAKAVGVLYLLTMATAVFSEMYVRGSMIVAGDAVQTAKNIVGSEFLFRLGIIADITTALGVCGLIWAIYVVLKPINKHLALLALLFRAIECALTLATIANSFFVLRLLSGATQLNVFNTEQLQVLSRLFLAGYGIGISLVFIPLGVGSTIFCYLWLKSQYIPRGLAILGIVGSLLVLTGGLAIMLFPNLGPILSLHYMMPLGIFEVSMGFWMLIKGLKQPSNTAIS